MKITCLWPLNISYSPSISILYNSKILENNNYDVDVIYTNLLFSNDLLNAPEEFIRNPKKAFKYTISVIEKTNPDILFIDSWREHIPFIAEFCRNFKARNPNINIIVGGHTPTFLPEKVLELIPEIDFILRSEAEYTFLDLIKAIQNNKNVNKIKGISYRNKRGEIVNTKNNDFIKNLDNIPLIDFENVVGYIPPKRIDIRTQRGCWGSCSFCSLHTMYGKPRFHSNEYVLKQIKHLKDLYDFNYFHLIDENFLSQVIRSERLAEDIHKSFPDLQWGGMFRADMVSENIIKTLRKNNFINAAVGIESNNKNILKLLNKSQNIDNYIKRLDFVIELLEKNLKILELGMIVGTPLETKEDLNEVIDFVDKIKNHYPKDLDVLRIAIGRLIIYPGTDVWKKYEMGDVKIFKTPENNSIIKFLDKYSHIPWAVPWDYTIRNFNFATESENINVLQQTIKRCSNE